MENANETLVRRIRKLLGLSRGDANEHESAAAAAKVHELLAEHNLSMAQIHQDTGSSDTTKRVKTSHDRSAMYQFQQDLMRSIAKTNFCLYFFETTQAESFGKMRKVKRHVLLGSALNMNVSMMLYDYLMDTMDDRLPFTGMEKRGRDALA
jgi:hypothetical protein